MLRDPFIADIKSITSDNRGVLLCNSLYFNWNSWLLCEVMVRKSNPVHRAIFCNFRDLSPGEQYPDGIWMAPTATRFQPSYEDEEYVESFRIDLLYYWKPVLVIPTEVHNDFNLR